MTHRTLTLVVLFCLSIPVSSLAKAPAGRFTVDAAGATVYDTSTKLTWQRTAPAIGGDNGSGGYTWANAKSYCQSLSLAGTGWRLPWVSELLGIVDRQEANPSIDPTAFPGAPADLLWSASPVQGNSYDAWYVVFNSGFSKHLLVSTNGRVRCVR